MANDTELQRQLDIEYSILRLRLFAGAASVKALMSMMFLGLASSASRSLSQAKAFAALANPTVEQKKDYELIRLMNSSVSEPAIAGAEAATIIYAHAILDAVLCGLCRLSAKIDPSPWAAFLEKKQITLLDAKSSRISDLENKLIEHYLGQLERESLLSKSDVLFKVIKPKSARGTKKGFKFSRQRLEELDRLRHGIVHGLNFQCRLKRAEAKCDYLLNTGQFFMSLVAKHHNIPTRSEDLEEKVRDAVEMVALRWEAVDSMETTPSTNPNS